MYCTNCGEKVQKDHKFCQNCGEPIPKSEEKIIENKKGLDTKDKSSKKITSKTEKSKLNKLEKLYKITGNLSIFKAATASIIGMLVGFKPENIITDLLVVLVLNAPYFYFGLKLRNEGIKNLDYSRKVTLGLFTYLTISIIINFLSNWMALAWLIISYYYYKSYKETKDVISAGLFVQSEEGESEFIEKNSYQENPEDKNISISKDQHPENYTKNVTTKKMSWKKVLLYSFLGWLLAKFIVGVLLKPSITQKAQNDMVWQEVEEQVKQNCIQKTNSQTWCNCFWGKIRYNYTLDEISNNPNIFLNDTKFQEEIQRDCKL